MENAGRDALRVDSVMMSVLDAVSDDDRAYMLSKTHRIQIPSPDHPVTADHAADLMRDAGLDLSDTLVGLEMDGSAQAVRIAEFILDAVGAVSDGGGDGLPEDEIPDTPGISAKRLKVRESKVSVRPVSKHSWCEDSRITHVSENPKKVGSAAHARFQMYRVGATLGEVMSGADGVTRDDVKFDLSRGYIQIAN